MQNSIHVFFVLFLYLYNSVVLFHKTFPIMILKTQSQFPNHSFSYHGHTYQQQINTTHLTLNEHWPTSGRCIWEHVYSLLVHHCTTDCWPATGHIVSAPVVTWRSAMYRHLWKLLCFCMLHYFVRHKPPFNTSVCQGRCRACAHACLCGFGTLVEYMCLCWEVNRLINSWSVVKLCIGHVCMHVCVVLEHW